MVTDRRVLGYWERAGGGGLDLLVSSILKFRKYWCMVHSNYIMGRVAIGKPHNFIDNLQSFKKSQ